VGSATTLPWREHYTRAVSAWAEYSSIGRHKPAWKRGDRIPRGRDTLEVVEVRYDQEPATLVIRRANTPFGGVVDSLYPADAAT
jgi:hypothetical protein